MKNFAHERPGAGTQEWSDYSYNICIGCAHDCLYCYAKGLARRVRPEMRIPGGWARQRLNPNRAALGAEVGAKGVVMFPTSHDLTPDFLPPALTTIKNLLRRNQVLIVSKPHVPVIRELCRELRGHEQNILFRFTIGALDRRLCEFWEPGAPPPQERQRALQLAHAEGFQTSVSIEPMLDCRERTCELVARLEPWVTDTLWIGKMQRIPRKANAHIPDFEAAVARLQAQQTDAEILRLVAALADHPKVRWKDSIKAVLARPPAAGRT